MVGFIKTFRSALIDQFCPGCAVNLQDSFEFTDEVENRTVVAGREATLSCHVDHLGSYKARNDPAQSDCVVVMNQITGGRLL